MSRQLYLNFIKDNRWKYIVNGLGTTLQITFFAVILGIALGFLIAVIRSTYDRKRENIEFSGKSISYRNTRNTGTGTAPYHLLCRICKRGYQ